MGWGTSIENTLQGAKETAHSAGAATASGIASAAKATGTAVKKTYNAIKNFFSPKLIGQPIQQCPLELEAKKERLKQRASLIATARTSAPSLPADKKKEVLDAAARFERENTAVERARLAENVYPNANGLLDPPPVGWKRLSDSPNDLKQYGLSPTDFVPKDSGFRAALYKSDIDGSVVVACKGTTFSSGEDWKNNARQGTAMNSDYYNRAIRLSKKLEASGTEFETTGHSLGGGMASAAGAVTGAKSTTFNAAGLRESTVERFGGSREGHDGQIQAYHVEGEVLTGVQSAPLIADAIGTSYVLPAVDEEGRSSVFDTIRPIDKHSMSRVIDGMEKQKADDQYVLKTNMGAP